VPHPKIDNRTPFAFEPVFLADEEGRPLLVPIVKATYDIGRSGLVAAAKQVPVNFTGEFWGEPGESSYRYEPETAFIKLTTDVVLIGHAHAPQGRATEVDVTLRVGSLQKTVRVFGDRIWKSSIGGASMTRPEPFARVPLTYERAFGGWDRSHPEPAKHAFEPRNPVGVGYCTKHGVVDKLRLPNLEDPKHLIKKPHDTPPPAGFGFISSHWTPRSLHGGTYDAAWSEDRMPLLPRDFDRRFFNAAPADLTSPRYLAGDEAVHVSNASPNGPIEFHLPAIKSLRCEVRLRGRPPQAVEPRLDTVVLDTDQHHVVLLWRGQQPLPTGPSDVVSIHVDVEASGAARR
jgi:hypothetical protein